MVLDFTAQLAPIYWGMVALLLLTTAGIVASADRELGQRYVAQSRLLVVGAAVALAAGVAVVGLFVGHAAVSYGMMLR